MFSRPFRILVLLFVVAWFGVILPGHTRGVVKLPGTTSCHAAVDTDSKTQTCCATKKSEQSPAKSGSCAICFFVMGLMFVTPTSFDFAMLGLVGTLAPPARENALLAPSFLPCQSRAPPASV